jgi:hypothetical protein
MEIVKSITHLKELCNINGHAEFEIILAGGLCKSAKRIWFYSEIGTFDIHNEIDDSWQEDLAEEELHIKTMIPEAIEKNAFFYCGYQLNGISSSNFK